MIHFNRTLLKNGLTILCNTDRNTPFVSVNILYKVGSRNEQDTRTGFAHLFEHLMFGGSAHVEDYDRHVQLAGGDSNAYTTNDLTNYYITIPADNIETALWLESDRMAALNFSQHALDVQKQVVIEEFKQRYLNNPYGDVWLKLRPLAYQVHPYRWPTIGMSPEHIEKATLTDVKNFFHCYYAPNNAIISLSGNRESLLTRREMVRRYTCPPPLPPGNPRRTSSNPGKAVGYSGQRRTGRCNLQSIPHGRPDQRKLLHL